MELKLGIIRLLLTLHPSNAFMNFNERVVFHVCFSSCSDRSKFAPTEPLSTNFTAPPRHRLNLDSDSKTGFGLDFGARASWIGKCVRSTIDMKVAAGDICT